MLMSTGIPLPKSVVCHGFVTAKDGLKMSKSLGNVVDPFVLLKDHDPDSLRYLAGFDHILDLDQDMLTLQNLSRHCIPRHLWRGHPLVRQRPQGETRVAPRGQVRQLREPFTDVVDLPKLLDTCERSIANYALQEYSAAVHEAWSEVNNWSFQTHITSK